MPVAEEAFDGALVRCVGRCGEGYGLLPACPVGTVVPKIRQAGDDCLCLHCPYGSSWLRSYT